MGARAFGLMFILGLPMGLFLLGLAASIARLLADN